MRSRITDLVELRRVEQALETYLFKYATEIDLGRVQAKYPEEWHRYTAINSQIIKMMAEADQLAAQLRSHEVA